MIQPISPEMLQEMLDAQDPNLVVLDVRTTEEYEGLGHLRQATHLPLHELPDKLSKLDPKKPTVLICEHGVRSTDACLYLSQNGFQNLFNLMDGMSSWQGPVVFGSASFTAALE